MANDADFPLVGLDALGWRAQMVASVASVRE